MKSYRQALWSASAVMWSALLSHVAVAAGPAAPAVASPHAAQTAAPTLRLPRTAIPQRYALDLSLRPSDDSYQGQVEISVQIEQASDVIWMHAGRELSIEQTTLKTATATLSPRVELVGKDLVALRFAKPLEKGTAKLELRFKGKLPLAEGSSIYRERDGSDLYIYSHFEPIDARRAFPCFDEPGFKVPWQVTMHVPKEHVALTNAPMVSQTDEANGMKKVVFKETPPLPSYLLTFAVGPFGVVDAGTAGKKNTPVRIVTLRGHEKEATYAAKVSGNLLSLLEDYFGIPYPYDKLDQIAVPGLRGAMEHPGLITYGQWLIQIKPEEETVRGRQIFATVAAHELGHQWAGNLVTLSFWDELWLNESLATFLESKIVGRFEPQWREVQNRVQRRQHAMSADSLITARKIRQPIESSDDIVNAFDGITYAKGGSVLEMFESWMGESLFAAGLSRYMREHSHRNGSAQDLIGAWTQELADAATKAKTPEEAEELKRKSSQLAPAIQSFLDQPGLPLVSASLACDKGVAKLSLSQTRYLPLGTVGQAEEIYKVPVCLRYSEQGKEQRMCKLLDGKQADWTLPGVACPDYVVVNADALGYYRVQYSPQLLSALTERAFFGKGAAKGVAKGAQKGAGQPALSEGERIALIGDQSALMRIGRVPADSVLALATAAASDESRHVVGIAAGVFSGLERVVPEAQQLAYQKHIVATFGRKQKELGILAKPKEDDNVKLLRGVLIRLVGGEGADKALIAEATSLCRKWLGNRSSVDPETVRLALAVAAEHGDASLFDALWQAAKAEPDRNQRTLLLGALGSFRNPQLAQRGIDLVLKGDVAISEAMPLLWGPTGYAKTRRLPFEFVKAHFEDLVAKLPKDAGARLSAMAGGLCSEAERSEAETFFTGRSTKYTGGPRNLKQTIERINQCAAFEKAQSASISSFFRSR